MTPAAAADGRAVHPVPRPEAYPTVPVPQRRPAEGLPSVGP
ncbi:hypothetical protein [Streptomyces sp. NPDC002164]